MRDPNVVLRDIRASQDVRSKDPMSCIGARHIRQKVKKWRAVNNMMTPGLKTDRFPGICRVSQYRDLTALSAHHYPNNPFNQYSPYQPGSPLNFPGSGSREFLQFPGFYYSSSHGIQQGAEQFHTHSTSIIAIASN